MRPNKAEIDEWAHRDLDTIQDFLCELGMKPSMQGDHHFFTIPFHRQTYQIY